MQVLCVHSGKIAECKATAKGNPKLPMGWKWIGDKAYSKESWNDLYYIKAVTVPIVSPAVNGNAAEMKSAWTTLDEQLKDAWQRSTEAANWAAKRLWSADKTRQQGQSKCPKMPKIYLYGERNWEGWSQSAAAVLRTVESSYREKRYEIIWTGSAGVPNVRYPYPYPVHNAGWKLEQEPGGAMIFEARLPSGRVAVRVKTADKGGKYRMACLKHLMENPDLRGESAIIKKHDGTVMIKMVGWFPKTIREQSGEMRVRTDKDSLLVLCNEKDEKILILNGDDIKQKITGHERMLQRWREDQKLEMRTPKQKKNKNEEDMKLACTKQNNRLDSFIKERSAQIVNHAKRRGLATIVFDGSDQGYFSSFPWFKLKTTLSQVCNRENIEFVERSSAEKTTATHRKRATPKEPT